MGGAQEQVCTFVKKHFLIGSPSTIGKGELARLYCCALASELKNLKEQKLSQKGVVLSFF